ncbi:delta tubulin [Plasmodium gonderi]|uniref:Tubulin delta chain n=1 Tax=Plasmodium gonderi TaxID=77519 RepID=A0A1Y1JIX9_PLAGO|nr:delta tubulin [Plasmodium gonderi]GAW80403.1 delta tubulin [Plasmodium gonderi]
MTVLSVQIGQCGNQLGRSFLDTIYNHICSSKNESFRSKLTDMYFDEEYQYGNNIFPIIEYEDYSNTRRSIVSESNNVMCLSNYIARCILIDMEPKVIEKCLYGDISEHRVVDNMNEYRTKKKKEMCDNIEDAESQQKYVCGMEEYYEPSNNLLKIFKQDKSVEVCSNTVSCDNRKEESCECSLSGQLCGHMGIGSERTNARRKREYTVNTWKYNNRSFIYGLNGSGNNWSYGFNVHAKNICEHFLNLMNKEMEKNESKENIDNILLFHSLAGGSGSGISSYISYLLKDEYPKVNLFNVCVLPYMFGEISVQSMNSILCLSSLYDVSDGIVLFENDKFELMCKRINNENINTDEINRYISLFLAYTIGLPVDFSNLPCAGGSARTSAGGSARTSAGGSASASASTSGYNKYTNVMNSVLRDLCCHPNYKLLTARYLPQVFEENMKFEQNSFNMLLKRMHKMLISGRVLDYDIPNNRCTAPGVASAYYATENFNVDPYFVRLSSRDLRNSCAFLKQIHIPIYLRESISKSYLISQQNSMLLKKGVKNYSIRGQTKNYAPTGGGSISTTNTSTVINMSNMKNRGSSPIDVPNRTHHHLVGSSDVQITNGTHFLHNNVVFSSKMMMRGEIQENINFDLFKSHVLYSNKSLNPIEVYIDDSKEFSYNSLSMISNCLTPIPTLKKILENAKMLYGSNAYMYQYNAYGVSHDQVHTSLMAIEQVISSYESFSSD